MRLESIEKALHKNGTGSLKKEYVEINGSRQGMIFESTNEENPLLLFLHGGPGFPIYPIIKAHGSGLEQFFTVCYWDQRGTGMSYHDAEASKALTVEQLKDDTIQVVHYLREKYAKDKVFLLGHSWGTFLGSLIVNQHPELFHAYIGVGQIGSFQESERESYRFILETAIDKRDLRAKKQIEKVPFDENYYQNRSYGNIKSKYTNKYGGGFKRSGYSNAEILKHVLACPHYTFEERMNIFRGSMYSYEALSKAMHTTDLVEQVSKLKLPVFILHGVHDYQTTHTQAKRFYESIEAPFKKMYTFHHSAHTPFIEEKDSFYEIMQNDVLGVLAE